MLTPTSLNRAREQSNVGGLQMANGRQITLGDSARDAVTDFRGVVTGVTQYLGGGVRYLIEGPRRTDGGVIEPQWFDEGRVELQAESTPVDLTILSRPKGLKIPAGTRPQSPRRTP